MMERRNAIVVGGGIGGLATAIALSLRGWRVEVKEKAAAFGEVGAGLSLWSNGVRALDALGLGVQLRERALTETEAGIRTSTGQWLSRTDVSAVERRFGPLVMIHRAHLLDVLRQAVPDEALRAGEEVTGIGTGDGRVEVAHNGEVSHADLVVGADGIHSVTRRSVLPGSPEPRYAGYTAWRLVADPGERLHVGGESWGRGHRVGLAPLPDGRIYLFGVANTPPGRRSPDSELAELRRRFASWHDPIPALLDAATEDAVLRHDIYELPPLKTFVAGRVALLGDAAHAMTPNLGQGANQALEDAVTLASVLDKHKTVQAALADYDSQRRPRAQAIAQRSARIGAVAQWNSAAATTIRNQVLRLAPASAMLRALAPVLSWRPPA